MIVGLVLVALVVPMLSGGSPGSAPTVASTVPAPTGPAPTAPLTASGPAAPRVAAAPATSGSNCSLLAAGWARTDALQPAPSVASALESPCALGHDVPALYFVSNSSASGTAVRFSLALPANGTPTAATTTAYWLGMWVGGVGCSYGGASYLTVEFLPPYDDLAGVNASPFWQVRAPVWDLVPAGTCDTQCENDTAFFTLDARRYCEDDAVTSGMGALASVEGAFRPGNLLSVDIAGTGGALTVRVNDTTEPSLDESWNYADEPIANGRNFVPLYGTASAANGGWTGGLDVGAGEMTCPLPTASGPFATPCNSYDGSVLNSSASVELLSVTSWNGTSHAYANRYPGLETGSSSGACGGASGVPACADFTSYGGTGTYPAIGISSSDGRAWYSLGGNDSELRSTFGGAAVEYPSSGNLSGLLDPTVLSATETLGTNVVAFDVRATDPNGVDAVQVTSWWCTASAVREEVPYGATLSGTPFNSTFDGNWTVNVPTGAAGMTGRFFWWAQARSASGAFSSQLSGAVNITTGAGGGCGASPPGVPGFASDDVASIGGGYALQWNETGSSATRNFTVTAQPAAGGATTSFSVGNVTSARITGLNGNVSYHLRVIAWDAEGLSARSAVVDANVTLYPLLLRAPNVTASSTWVNQTTVRVTANATGGVPLFTFEFAFGDGATEFLNTSGDEASLTHYYGRNFTGDARIAVSVTDSVGDAAAAPPAFADVRGSPLAVPATIAGGNGFVDVSWRPPVPPPLNATALAPTGYRVYWTTNASWAPYLTGAGSSAAGVPDVTVLAYPADATVSSLGVPNGATAYAQVVALNTFGAGLLGPVGPSGASPVLSATAEPFDASPIGLSPGAGGPAPLVENFTTSFTMSPGTTLSNATYRFSNGAFVPATIFAGDGSAWANASYTFVAPGLFAVTLYALDSVSDLDVVASSVLVTPGPAPVVSVVIAPTPVWVNASVGLSATATGGSGQYSYAWSVDTTPVASGGNTTYQFPSAGTYLVSVVVTDSVWGGATTVTVPVSVFAPPTVEIAVTANGGPGTYRFSALVQNGYGNLSYTWIFGDGSQGAGATVSHTFATPNSYNVTVEVQDSYGHTVTASTLVVYGGTTYTTAGSSGVPYEDVYFLLAVVAALALLVLLLLIRGRRTPPSESEAPPSETYDDAAPPPNYEEDPPSLR